MKFFLTSGISLLMRIFTLYGRPLLPLAVLSELGVYPGEFWLLIDGWWGWLFQIVAFGISWFCVHKFIRKNLWGSFFATVVISSVAVLFHGFILFYGLIVLHFLRIDEILFSFMKKSFIFPVIMLVFTESCVALLFYKIVDKKRMIMWLTIAHVLSMGVGIGIVGKIKMAIEEKEKQEQAMTPKERKEREKRRRRLDKHKLKVIKKR